MNGTVIEVIFCTDGIFPHAIGGMQRHSRLLIEELAKDPHIALSVIHPHTGIKVFPDLTGVNEIVIDPGKSTGRYLRDCYNYSIKVNEIIKAHPKAIIYSQGLSVWHNIKETGFRVIINPHGLEPYQALTVKDKLITAPFRMIFGYLFKHAAAVVSLGGRLTGILENILGNEKNRIAVLPNAVNITHKIERSFNTEPLKFLFVGRFAFNKGIRVLLEAVKELNTEGYEKKLHFDLVGKGPLFESYKKKYAASNINFAGFADDNALNKFYRDDDVFVFPTLFEGMPTVVLEAMACSMPVIVTDVGATKELVNEMNGYIIETKDIASLKSALLRYYNLSPVERKLLSDHSWLKVKDNFTWPVVAEKHKQLFRSLNELLTKNKKEKVT